MVLQPPAETKLPGVTVTISAYNYAKVLPFAIESVLAQDYPEFEIVVVDDGSKDNTAEVAASFGDKIRYIRQTNAGLSAARNTGIKAAKYDFVAFLDADGCFKPTMLRKIMEAFATLPPDYAVVACRTCYMDYEGRDLRTKMLLRSEPETFTARDFILKNRCSADAVIVRKSVFAEVGDFDTSLKSSEDRDMWIRIGARYKIFLLPDELLKVRRHPNSMSKHAERMKTNCQRVLKKAYDNATIPRTDWVVWLRASSFL
jgi:glycosyltransferase involved in cell wall biosynthesis